MFKDFSKFDKQYSVFPNLLSEIEGEKLTDESVEKFIHSTLSIKVYEIQQRLEHLKAPTRLSELEAVNKVSEKLSDNNDSSDDKGEFFPTPPAFLPSPSSFSLDVHPDVPTSLPKNN